MRGIHTCLDTSGITYREELGERFQELFENLDLVLLDMKHSTPQGHLELTGQKRPCSGAGEDSHDRAPCGSAGSYRWKRTSGTAGRAFGSFSESERTGSPSLPYYGAEKIRGAGHPIPLERSRTYGKTTGFGMSEHYR